MPQEGKPRELGAVWYLPSSGFQHLVKTLSHFHLNQSSSFTYTYMCKAPMKYLALDENKTHRFPPVLGEPVPRKHLHHSVVNKTGVV